MKKITGLVFIFIFLFSMNSFSSQMEWVAINQSTPVKCKPLLISGNSDQSEISIQLPGFFKEEIQTPRGNAFYWKKCSLYTKFGGATG